MYSNDLPDMSEALRQVYEKKKLDAVGKEDGDIDNDGDKDNTDSYLLNRRKTVTKALGKKTHICAKLVGYKKEEWETIPEMHTMLEDGTVTHYDIMREGVIRHNVPVEELDILISEKHEHFDNYDKNAEMLGESEKPLPKNKMFRKAGNLGRDVVSPSVTDDQRQKAYDRSKKIIKTLNKANEELETVDEAEQRVKAKADKKMKVYGGPAYIKKPDVKKAEVQEGKFTGSKSSVERNAVAYSGDRNAAERRKDRRILATYYGEGGKKSAIERAKKERDEKRAARKEAFAFSDVELEELALLEEIDAMSDEQLIDMMEDIIIETAEDIDDLIEICEHLEEVEILSEERDAGAMAREKLNKPAGPSRMDRLKSAAKAAGSKLKAGAAKAGAAVKKGVKAAGKSAAANTGKAVGTFQANRIKAKRAELSKPSEKKKEAPKSSSSDDDGTGGKLDALLSKTRGTSSSSSSDSGSSSSSGGGGSSSSSSSSGSTRKAVGGALRKVGSLVKKGLKKAVGKTARVVSSGSDKLAKRLGEDYEQIADMYESGMFSIQEIENVVELYKGKHGQTDKQYADSRSSGGKMVSGDSKMSGAEYTHGRRVKAANPGMQPDVGGKTKPKSQGKMDRGTRADIQYRKANLKKKD
ncbi:hypothetical protein Np010709_176 [Synechococcus phage S-RIM2]|uniref:Uncharacterized protein n=1 Tax=Synechococcus phage S-RIM2 TaxID=687800 RepID=A0A1D7RFB3_9CAUD|nr:hypothetical protein Np010709_176 [Synechococcus phage S-RIM2]